MKNKQNEQTAVDDRAGSRAPGQHHGCLGCEANEVAPAHGCKTRICYKSAHTHTRVSDPNLATACCAHSCRASSPRMPCLGPRMALWLLGVRQRSPSLPSPERRQAHRRSLHPHASRSSSLPHGCPLPRQSRPSRQYRVSTLGHQRLVPLPAGLQPEARVSRLRDASDWLPFPWLRMGPALP